MTGPGTGRYAPSPTGALHLGNLRTAVAAWCSARARGLRFLLRIEDLDGPRCRPGHEATQLEDLRQLGIDWDEPPLRQSERSAVYTAHLERLVALRLAYPCFCSRREIRESVSAPHGPAGAAYPGTCARLDPAEAAARIARGDQHCWRLRVDQAPATFFDAFVGEVPIDLRAAGGDFVIRRADGLFAYQMACAVDDALSGVTEVVRGDDLLDSGARQAYLLACLRLPVPLYRHLPLVHAADGTRLAKRLGSQDLRGLLARGHDLGAIIGWMAWSLGHAEPGERLDLPALAARWDWRRVPRTPVAWDEQTLAAWRR
jgi:glutamyl-tRNA synthetase